MSQTVPPQVGRFHNVVGLRLPRIGLIAAGRYHGQIIRRGRVIDEWEDDNLVVNEGLNSLLSVYFNSGTQITAWYCGLFEGNYTPTATVTAATIASAATECTAYVAATRPAWTIAPPASQSVTNSANRASFVFNASKTVYGAFLVSSQTKSGTSGTLFSAARFANSKSVETDDELLLTYAFTAASA